MALIEREALTEVFADADPDVMADYGPDYGSEWGFSREAAEKLIKSIPTIDAAPVVHGRWIAPTEMDGHTVAECSNCHKIRVLDDYCSACGARMGGGN